MADKPLKSLKQEIAAQALAVHGNAAAACRAIGSDPRYYRKDDTVMHPAVQARAREIVKTRFDKLSITADRVMTELARVGFATAKDLFDEKGNMIPIHLLDDDVAATITGIETETRTKSIRKPGADDDDPGTTEEVHTTVTKFKRADKMVALNVFAKHFKIVDSESDGVNALANALADRLDAAKRRTHQPLQDVEDARMMPTSAEALSPEPRQQRLAPTPPEPQPAAPTPAAPQGADDEERLW